MQSDWHEGSSANNYFLGEKNDQTDFIIILKLK